MSKQSHLVLIVGPMFSGKTSYLINVYNDCIQNGEKVVVINYKKDTRYDSTRLSTHDGRSCPCVFVDSISESLLLEEVQTANVVLINEGQFFPDIYDKVLPLVDIAKKRVYVCGLDGDFKRERFGRLLDLVPVCDSIVKLTANCYYCSRPAIFSHRKSDSKEQVLIGAADMYVPLCRACYLSQQ
jgi:thymidine kinase